ISGGFDEIARVWEAAGAEQVAAWQEEERVGEQDLAALKRERTAEQERQRMVRAHNEGAIKRWLVLAPIALATGQSGAEGLDTEQIEGEGQLQPKAGDKSSVGNGELVWQEAALEHRFSEGVSYVIDFNAILRQQAPQSVAYAVC